LESHAIPKISKTVGSVDVSFHFCVGERVREREKERMRERKKERMRKRKKERERRKKERE
jgi:hypothetical protein